MLVKDIFELRYHLRCKLLLFQVVSTLHYDTYQSKVLLLLKTTESVLHCDLLAYVFEGLVAEEAHRFLSTLATCFS